MRNESVESKLRLKFQDRLAVRDGIAYNHDKVLGPVNDVIDKITKKINDDNTTANNKLYCKIMMFVLIDYATLDEMNDALEY